MNFSYKLFFTILILFQTTLLAQDSYLLTGKVTDEKTMPIPGVNVIVTNTTNGTSTDFDGLFQIQVKPKDVLQFSYVGYVTQTVIITNQQTLNITFKEDANTLDEIVVIGYGTQRKSSLTGAISKIVNEDLEQLPVSRVDDALVGQVSGVNIQATEGEAGSAPTIRIRGTGSITGDSNPTIVVDGLIVDNDFLGSLDMNDVESFSVLKDAASAAIYGSRGGNGVIIITTKQGKEGKTKFTYSTYTGLKEARQSDDYYFSVAETAQAELAATGALSDRTRYKQLIGIDRDWQDIIFDGGTISSHSFGARGGSKKTKFSTAFNYLHDEGVLLTDDFKRYSFKVKVDTKANDKFKFGASFTPSYTNRRRFDGSVHDILRQTPWLPVYHDANTIRFVNSFKFPDVQIGDYATQRHFDDFDLATGLPIASGGTDISNTSNTNPAAKVLEKDRKERRFKILGSVYAAYDITEDLNFRTALSGDYQNTNRSRWQGKKSNRNGDASLEISNQNRIHLVTDNYLTYNKILERHNINAVAGFSAEKFDTANESVLGIDYESDLIRTIAAAPTIADADSFEIENSFMSFFGRLNYAFDDKYLFSFSYRRDGSSIFGKDNKFGDFPAVSAGWIVTNEKFLENSDFLNNLKLRFSYGFTGNNRLDTGDVIIDNYPSISLLGSSTAVVNNEVISAVNALNIANPELKWERSQEINYGIDFGFFNNRITGSVDYYTRTSDQLLLDNPISSTTGFTKALVNIGEVENKGFEAELRTRNISTEKFKWSTTFIASRNENELVNFADSNGQILNVDSKRAAEWINLEGNPISSFYGWVVDRDIPLEFINDPYHPVGGEAQDVYVKDLNGDGLIDDDDKTILGNPYPDIIWSISNEFQYGNVDLSFQFQGSHGAEVRNMGDQYLFNQFNSSQDFTADTPNQGFIKQKIFTNDIIQDASYIALRNVNIGYTISKDLLEKINLFTRVRIYGTAQNLLYFTADGYTGFNPEFVENTRPAALTYGYQRAGSPIFRTMTLGVNLEF
ncbi:TonB-dependent receptor [Aquimarina sp. MMG016]|uniref:SusC/RagA family TonB-linked outer membrane protein n=1 Tax=Aquimarina sp. MMG016 TaxID=2822690 RepID=UPI001B3A299B|nr:TonB-dependent receptor [Aquimarina sp. MMG016]MBQ4821009.1 TonB-dependent receptor [Aquimarina sp. MMG016]